MSQLPDQHLDQTAGATILPINSSLSMMPQAPLPQIIPTQANIIPNMYIQNNLPAQEDTSKFHFFNNIK